VSRGERGAHDKDTTGIQEFFRELVLDVLIAALSLWQVYKGMFGDGTMLAVKLLKNTQQVGTFVLLTSSTLSIHLSVKPPSHEDVNWTYK
jgi:hypothetical protein